MDRWLGQVAVVTGASAGIGSQIAQQLTDHGLKVVGLARRKERLEVLEQICRGKKGQLYYFVTDICKEEDIVNAFQWIKENVGVVNILINCAGISRFSSLMEGNSKHIKDILDTNIFGLCITTREALKVMQSNKVDGHIIHINSILGHSVGISNCSNVYPASKFATTALTETLRNELSLSNSKIKISSISPGYVLTELIDTAMKNSDGYAEEDQKAIAMHGYLTSLPVLFPKDVADAVIYVLSTPPHVQIHELIVKPVGEQF